MTAQARQPLSAWPPFNVDSGTYRGNRKIGVAESDFSMPLHGRPQVAGCSQWPARPVDQRAPAHRAGAPLRSKNAKPINRDLITNIKLIYFCFIA
ncbi:hypothetical protein ACFQX9_27800 [Bradyrhizobium sp. GCM10028915]|uniref:hypothetical protein n=1 Tax=Bradyrhizobium sp. GCM10028915 TaxID=3273385 RepID=UPI0036131981